MEFALSTRTRSATRHLTRVGRGVLAAVTLAVLFTATACAAESPDADITPEGGDSLSVSYVPGPHVGHIALAEQLGILADHGIDSVDYVSSESGPASAAALVSGSVDLTGFVPNLVFPLINEGEDIVILMNTWNQPQQLFVTPAIAAKASGTYPENIQALAGTSVGVSARGSLAESSVTRMLTDAGMQATDVNFIAVGSGASAVAAMTAGQIDALLAFAPVDVLLDPDKFEILVDSESMVEDVYGGQSIQVVWATTRAFLEENTDLVGRFCDAMWEAQEFSRDDANLERMADFGQTDIGTFTDDQALAFAKNYQEYYDLGLSEELWDSQADFLAEGVELPDYADSVLEDCATPR